MQLTALDLDLLARQLVDARDTLTPVSKPAGMSKEQASLVKRKAFELLCARGSADIAGYKVSMSYTWGALTADKILSSPAALARSSVFDPLVETEAVFLLDADIPADASIDYILAHSRVAAGIEVADSRWVDWCPSDLQRFVKPDSALIEADNALSSWMVIAGDSRIKRSG